MQDISSQEFLEINKLSPEQRFDYMLQCMQQEKQLWGLYGKNGWLLLQAEDDVCMPVWPKEDFARAWEKQDFPDCVPKAIELDAWQQQWLPGMKNNGTLILLFPLSDDEEGIMLEAQEFIECLDESAAS